MDWKRIVVRKVVVRMSSDDETLVYAGDENKCSFCKKAFRINEEVMVDEGADRLFCIPEDIGQVNCVIQWTAKNGKGVVAIRMKFHGNT